MTKKETFVFSLAGWIAATGLYSMVRFFGTAEVVGWMASPFARAFGWLPAALPLALVFWLLSLAGDSALLRKTSYGFLILVKVTGMVLAAIAAVFTGIVVEYFLGTFPLAGLVPAFIDRLLQPTLLGALAYVIVVTFVLSLVRVMILMNGKRVVVNLIFGKYRRPRIEEAVFMFVDLKSSTTIAEKLGHVRYSQLIQDCFADLTDALIKHEADVYQYVGDEAVLIWPTDKGLENNNCIHSYFEFQSSLAQRADYYRGEYGLVPEFKAGVNAGEVMVTEVGVIKREIAWHSDVLNTAARMEGKCRELGQQLLISEKLREMLPSDGRLTFEPVGSIPLRGKEEVVGLVGVSRSDVLA